MVLSDYFLIEAYEFYFIMSGGDFKCATSDFLVLSGDAILDDFCSFPYWFFIIIPPLVLNLEVGCF
jgi:hypothetical protein